MNRRGRLAKVTASFDAPRWPRGPVDVETASDDELLAIMASDAELGELVRQCFAGHPAGTWFGRNWPDHKRPERRCGLSAYLFGHPELGGRAEAIVDGIAEGSTADA